MNVVGLTNQQEVYIASTTRNFRMNEFLMVCDAQGDLPGEIIAANTFNKYIPLSTTGEIADGQMLEALRNIGYSIDDETIYLGKLRLIQEAPYPVITGSAVREPDFEELRHYFFHGKKEESLCLGVVKNTASMTKNMDEELKDLLYTFEEGKLKRQEDIPYFYHLHSMHHYPHMGIFGGSGSGKSYGLRVILEELLLKKIPSLVVDPHYEMDFSESAVEGAPDFKGNFSIFRLGENMGIRFTDLNTGDIKNLLSTSSPLSDSMLNVVESLHRRGDDVSSFESRLSLLIEAQNLGNERIIREKIGNSDSLERQRYEAMLELFRRCGSLPTSSVEGIRWRLQRLIHMNVFQNNANGVLEAMKSGKLAVLQGNTRVLQVFSTYLIGKCYQLRRLYQDSLHEELKGDYFPPFIIITDEAHNFAPQGYEASSKVIFREIAQEGRKYGVFLILATQRPSLLDSTVTAQLNTKLIFRTVRAGDIDTIREETDIGTEEAKRLPYLSTGDVFISESALGRTISGRIRAAYTKTPHGKNPFDELRDKEKENLEESFELIREKLPFEANDLVRIGQELEAEGKGVFSVAYLEAMMERLEKSGKLRKKEGILGLKYLL